MFICEVTNGLTEMSRCILVDIVSESENKMEVNSKSNLKFVASGIGGRERYMV